MVDTNQDAPPQNRVGMGDCHLRIGGDDGGPAAEMRFFDKAPRVHSHQGGGRKAELFQVEVAVLAQRRIGDQLSLLVEELIFNVRLFRPLDVLQHVHRVVKDLHERWEAHDGFDCAKKLSFMTAQRGDHRDGQGSAGLVTRLRIQNPDSGESPRLLEPGTLALIGSSARGICCGDDLSA